MKISEVAGESIIFAGITISERYEERLDAIIHNKNVFKMFNKIVIAINIDFLYNDNEYTNINTYNEKDLLNVSNFLKNAFGENKTIIISNPINRGWQVGLLDLDKTAFDYARLNYNWAKYFVRIAPDDSKVYKEFLNLDLDESVDFYGLPFIKEWVSKMIANRYYNKEFLQLMYNSAANPFEGHVIFFQAQQYIIKNSDKIDTLYCSINKLNQLYNLWLINKKDNDENIEWKYGIEIEKFIANTIVRNKLNAKYLLNFENYIYFLNRYIECKTKGLPFDIALRNIYFEDLGLMHYHKNGNFRHSIINCTNKTFFYTKSLVT